jgi:hypothetical protein
MPVKIGLFPILQHKFDNMNFLDAVSPYAHLPLTRHLMLQLLKDYKRPNDKISELIKQKVLVYITRGLYIIGPSYRGVKPTPFMIANYLLGPSYISTETALAYWGLIPERTFEISSCTLKRTRSYETTSGRYSFYQLRVPYYAIGLKSVEVATNQMVLMASPEKALCDKIVLTPYINLRSTRETWDFLLHDMRLDEKILASLNMDLLMQCAAHGPKENSFRMLIKTLNNS